MQRKTFTQGMQQAKDEIVLLGSLVEDAVIKSATALKDNDMDASRRILQADRLINIWRYETEGTILVLMSTQRPAARDLRKLAACLYICTELERIGDYAKGIASINLRAGGLSMPNTLQSLFDMATQSLDMLHRSITAFIDEDSKAAQTIIREDDKVDFLYKQIYNQAIQRVVTDAQNIERANYIIWVAHNLERIGDRATNICERVIFAETGELPGMPAST